MADAPMKLYSESDGDSFSQEPQHNVAPEIELNSLTEVELLVALKFLSLMFLNAGVICNWLSYTFLYQ